MSKVMNEAFDADLYLENLEAELFGVEESTDINSPELRAFIIDCLESTMDDDDNDLITEGFNRDINENWKENNKKIKDTLKAIKLNIKAKNYEEARLAITVLNKTIDDMIADVNSAQGTMNETVIGMLMRSCINFGKTLVAFIVTMPIGGFTGAFIMGIKNSLMTTEQALSKIVSKVVNKEEITPDDFNSFKNAIVSKYKDYKVVLKKLDSKVAELEKKAKTNKAEEINESVSNIFEQEKLKLYEACNAGEITEDQREALIERFKLTEKIEESVEINDVTSDNFSAKDAFNRVKKDIYERCANGEFDIDTREDLVKEAYNRFFEGEDSPEKIVDNIKKKADVEQAGNKLVNDVTNSMKNM